MYAHKWILIISACILFVGSCVNSPQVISLREFLAFPGVAEELTKSDDTLFYPKIYTCNAENISPPLPMPEIDEIIGSLPSNCSTKKIKSYAIIFRDMYVADNQSVNWIIFNISPDIKELPENIEKTAMPDLGFDKLSIQPIQGINDFGNIGYDGPCPPEGETHWYAIEYYGLDKILKFNKKKIQQGITDKMIQKAMDGHIIIKCLLPEFRYKK